MQEMEGTTVYEEDLYGCQVTTVDVQSEHAAKLLGRTVGRYITIHAPNALHEDAEIAEVGECLAAVLDRVLRPYYRGKLCICGIGNRNVPADSLGPEVTYNLPLKVFSETGMAGNFRDVCSISPGTEMSNNIETKRIVEGVIQAIGADCVLLVDSSTTTDVSRLFRTIQLSTAGGIVNYFTKQIGAWSDLGVPVVSLVVPTAIPLFTLRPEEEVDDTLLTSTRVHEVIAAAGIIIAYALLRVCWPSLSEEGCVLFAKSNRDPLPYSPIRPPGTEGVASGAPEG